MWLFELLSFFSELLNLLDLAWLTLTGRGRLAKADDRRRKLAEKRKAREQRREERTRSSRRPDA